MSNSTKDFEALFMQEVEKLQRVHQDEAGSVVYVADMICRISGLADVLNGEVVLFDNGNKGLILDLSDQECVAFLLNKKPVHQGEGVRRTGHVVSIPVGEELLGRVVDVLGDPLDGLSLPYKKMSFLEVEQPIKGIDKRKPVNEPLETGILVLDSVIPIGKGQRQLFVGPRASGKTTAALDIIINQKGKNVICVYVAVAQRQAYIARFVDELNRHQALDYTVIVSADASQSAVHHYLAPYSGCTIAEHFAAQGKDVLIVYDDLSNHAIAYREMSLLMKRSPGREAYPGDVFYLHSRLLERAGNFLPNGSITAFPIVQIQESDISAYIPTNLISITDGQVFFDIRMFNSGVRPAVNTELSVSRIGGAAQPSIINSLSKALRLHLAQYHELVAFAQFGGEIDEYSSKRIKRGELLVEILKQSLGVRYSVADEVILLFLYRTHEEKLLQWSKDELSENLIWITSYISKAHSELYNKLVEYKDIKLQDVTTELNSIIEECFKILKKPEKHTSK